MIEYLLRRVDGEQFDLAASQMCDALRPSSLAAERVEGWGDWRIVAEGVETGFSHEGPGIQVCFEGQPNISFADKVMEEIRQNLERITGQQARIVRL